jgi:hypothetical protein
MRRARAVLLCVLSALQTTLQAHTFSAQLEKFVTGLSGPFYTNPTNANDAFPNSLNFGDLMVFDDAGNNMALNQRCSLGFGGWSSQCSAGVDGKQGTTGSSFCASGDVLTSDWFFFVELSGMNPPVNVSLFPRPGGTAGRASNVTIKILDGPTNRTLWSAVTGLVTSSSVVSFNVSGKFPSATPTCTPTPSVSVGASASVSPTISPTPLGTPSVTSTLTPTATQTASQTNAPFRAAGVFSLLLWKPPNVGFVFSNPSSPSDTAAYSLDLGEMVAYVGPPPVQSAWGPNVLQYAACDASSTGFGSVGAVVDGNSGTVFVSAFGDTNASVLCAVGGALQPQVVVVTPDTSLNGRAGRLVNTTLALLQSGVMVWNATLGFSAAAPQTFFIPLPSATASATPSPSPSAPAAFDGSLSATPTQTRTQSPSQTTSPTPSATISSGAAQSSTPSATQTPFVPHPYSIVFFKDTCAVGACTNPGGNDATPNSINAAEFVA